MSRFVEELDKITAQVADLIDDTDDWPAIQHKLEEALGPLRVAQLAATQYEDGTLESPA